MCVFQNFYLLKHPRTDFSDLTEFGASSNQTEDVTFTTCGKQSYM